MAMVKKTELAYCCVLKIIVWILAQPTVIVQNAAANKNLKVVQTAIPFPAILVLPQPAPVKPQIPDVKHTPHACPEQLITILVQHATRDTLNPELNVWQPLAPAKPQLPAVKPILLAYQVQQHTMSARLATPVIPYLHQNAPKPLVQAKHPLPDVKHIAELVYPVLQHIISVPSVIQDIN